MPSASRVSDDAGCPSDSHGKDCCSHGVTGPAVEGSPDVIINGQPALRLGDPGVHSTCCGPNTWECVEGSATVFVNGRPKVRVGDATAHCGGAGKMIQGSPDVIVGGASTGGGGSTSPPPSDCPLCEKVKAGGASVSTASPHPVHAPTGAKFLAEDPDFSLPGNLPLVWTRIYNTRIPTRAISGPGGPCRISCA
jgi:uncharacterized Zn-binding protein involved in type VI secretion